MNCENIYNSKQVRHDQNVNQVYKEQLHSLPGIEYFFGLFVLVELRIYSVFCTQGSLQAGFGDHTGSQKLIPVFCRQDK